VITMTKDLPALLWTIDDYLERSTSPHPRVRAWAMQRLCEQHPLRALVRAVDALGDEEPRARFHAFELLRSWGDASLVPGVLAGLEDAQGNELAKRARLLADWGCEEAVDPLIVHMSGHSIDPDELGALCHAFSKLAPERLSPWAKHQLHEDELDYIGRQVVVHGLADCHIQADIAWLVEHWLDEPRYGGIGSSILEALRRAVGPKWLAETLPRVFSEGSDAVATLIEKEEQVRLPLTETELDEMLRATELGMASWPGSLLSLAQDLIEDRGLPVDAWCDDDERPDGYRWQVLATVGLLEHLVVMEGERRTLDTERRRTLLALSLAGLAGILADQDDLAWLDGRGDERREALLELLASPRERIPRQIERELAALGPDIVPNLVETLGRLRPYWSAHRAAQVLERIAAAQPEPCLGAVDTLLTAADQDPGDFINESAYRCLQLLGPAAAPEVLAKLHRDGDEHGALADVLACYPIQQVVDTLHSLLLSGGVEWEALFMAFVSLASEDSIDRLVQAGLDDHGDPNWAQALLDLCAIRSVSHAHEPRWLDLVEQDEALQAERRAEWNPTSAAAPAIADVSGVYKPPPTKAHDRDKARKTRKAQRQQRKKARGKKRKKKR
jgi:hypothetical protein